MRIELILSVSKTDALPLCYIKKPKKIYFFKKFTCLVLKRPAQTPKIFDICVIELFK